MEFLIENWYLLLAAAAIIVVSGVSVYTFLKKPTSEQLAAVKEWLLYAVIEAEKKLGGGTGQVKLRYVYDMFVGKFGVVAELISFELFSNLVDEALEKMREMLKSNEAVKAYVNGEKEGNSIE